MPLIEDAEFPEEEPQPPKKEEDALPEFDARHRDDFTGLLYLGGLTRSFTFNGHKFVIRTLRTEEILAVGLIVKDYEGAPSQMKAYATALISVALVTIDGRPLETPYREETASENLRFRMDTVSTWYPQIIDVIYNEYLILDKQVSEVFESMGKVSG